jgi:hypothetical protein
MREFGPGSAGPGPGIAYDPYGNAAMPGQSAGGMGGLGGGGIAAGTQLEQTVRSDSGVVQLYNGQAVTWSVAEGHLASLDVDLPERGQQFLFTTPRGEIQITAHGFANPVLERLIRLLVILGGAVALWILIRLACWAGPSIRQTIAGAVLLIVFGFGSVVLGILPVVGLVLLVLGLAQGVRLARGKRQRIAG